jgi:hypothetical protein
MPVITSETAMYSRVTIASEPKMPIGMLRCGFFVSSAVVATTSKPMKAKNTMAAAAATPPQPNTLGSRPKRVWTSGRSSAEPCSAEAPCEGGTKGTQLETFTRKMPAMMTAKTTISLIAVTTWFTREETFTPTTRIAVMASTSRPAGRLMNPPSAVATASGSAAGCRRGRRPGTG